MTAQLPPSEYDATYDEEFDGPRPDGYIKVVFKDTRQFPQVFDFSTMSDKGWTWRNDERGDLLVIHLKSNTRIEIPKLGILELMVTSNSDRYMAWKKMEEAAQHVIQLKHHLEQAEAKYDEARERWATWRDMS